MKVKVVVVMLVIMFYPSEWGEPISTTVSRTGQHFFLLRTGDSG